jgi:putative membrane protein
MMGTSGMGWMWIWPVLVLIGLLVVGYGVWRLAQGDGGSRKGADADSSARRILDERYARGEIDDEEYRRRRDAMR